MLAPLLCAVVQLAPAQGPIRVDGRIEEPAWPEAARVTRFYETYPGENLEPKVGTEAFLAYDRKNLYIAFRCSDPRPDRIRANYADRDASSGDDRVGVYLDTFHDQRRAVYFTVTALGSQSDGTYSEYSGLDASWDTVWDSASRLTESGFEVEMAIPFASLRFPDQETQEWGILLKRAYTREADYSISSHTVDRNLSCMLCDMDVLAGLVGVRPGHNIELIPALTALRSWDRPSPQGPLRPGDTETQGSLSAAWGVTPNLTAIAALNPDFSQVEADAFQLDVNRRFSLYYPEKRPFFMEGADLFRTPIEVLYTRSIADPDWGAKLTGKEGAMGIGVLAARDAACNFIFPGPEGSSDASWDRPVLASALRLKEDVGEGSSIGLVATHREAEGYHNTVGGLDADFRLSGSDMVILQALTASTKYPLSPDDAELDGGSFRGHALDAAYYHGSRNWSWNAGYSELSPGFRADLGFIPQVDLRNLNGSLTRIGYPDPASGFTSAYVGGSIGRRWTFEGGMLSEGGAMFAGFDFALPGSVGMDYSRTNVRFNGREYRAMDWGSLSVSLRPSKVFTFSALLSGGDAIDYVNERPGREAYVELSLAWKPARVLALSAAAQSERLRVHEGELYAARIYSMDLRYFFSARLFLRGIVQYMGVRQDPDLHPIPLPATDRTLGSQLLLSYRVNAFTLAYLGYSDSGIENDDVPRTIMNRACFIKFSYAWRP